MNIKKAINAFQFINLKTLVFNLKYFPFKTAIKLPILISSKTYLLKTKGKIIIHGDILPGMIRIGYGEVGLFDKKRLRAIWEVEGEVHFYGNALFKFGSKISVGQGASLYIGDGFRISPNSSIVCFKSMRFGDNVRISWETILMDTDFHTIKTLEGEKINPPKEINIGNNVWIGMRATIMKGVTIENNNIIGTNSLVNKSIAGSFQIIAGNPAKVIKKDVDWNA